MTELYEILNLLGEGSFGIVYKARSMPSGRTVALKDIKIFRERTGFHRESIGELSILKHIPSHPNVVKLLDFVLNTKVFLMEFEYMPTDLNKFIQTYGEFKLIPLELIKSFTYQLLSGLAYCHDHQVIHRDLKPQNILVKQNKIVKLADFGLAGFADVQPELINSGVGTLWYRSPEILLGATSFSYTNDVWALGCIMAEMINRAPLFPGGSELGQLYSIFRILKTPTEITWPGITQLRNFKTTFPQWMECLLWDRMGILRYVPEGFDLIQRLLIQCPEQRLTAKKAYQHPFFTGFKPALPLVGRKRARMEIVALGIHKPASHETESQSEPSMSTVNHLKEVTAHYLVK